MAINVGGPRPDYPITVTLTAGKPEFTAAGGALDVVPVRPGDSILTASGAFLVIAEITGGNTGKLVWNCPASAAGSNQTARIRFQPEGSRLMGTAADILARFSSGNVTSFADLQSQQDMFAYFSGIGKMALAKLTPFARTQLAATNADDQMPPRLGMTSRRIPGADWNNATENGWWMEANAANAPYGSNGWFIGEVQRHNDLWIVQTVTQFTSANAGNPQISRRIRNNGTWQDWYPLSLLFGTNSNGNLQEFPNGMQICTITRDATSEAWTTASGSVYLGPNYLWTFPRAFGESFPFVDGATTRSGDEARDIVTRNITSTAVNVRAWSSVPLAAGAFKTVTYIAIGKRV